MRLSGLLILLALPSFADQTRIPNYRQARELLWSQVYPDGGNTLYCGESFQKYGRLFG